MIDLKTANNKLIKLESRRELLSEKVSSLKKELEESASNTIEAKQSSALIQYCAGKLRNSMTENIESTVTWAIKLILNEDFKFKMDFVQKRNQWECEFKLIDPDGREVDLKNGTGGGIIDTVSLSLFILFTTLFSTNSKLPVILDEPLKFLSTEIPEYAERAILFLKGLSQRLGLQIIMITHQDPLVPAADLAYKFEIKNKVTVIQNITSNKAIYEE